MKISTKEILHFRQLALRKQPFQSRDGKCKFGRHCPDVSKSNWFCFENVGAVEFPFAYLNYGSSKYCGKEKAGKSCQACRRTMKAE